MQGPLRGVRVLEFAGIGPVPFCAMLLSDMGADVVRIDRSVRDDYPDPILNRGRSSIVLDLKSAQGQQAARDAMARADVVIEGYRPGVMERLGLGPNEALAANPALIYGRLTGWGQTGPLAHRAGHDINYIALTGALDEIGQRGGPPIPPLNLVGDFGGGSLYLAFGIAAALFERERSGKGQVIDAAIVDGVASMMGMFTGQSEVLTVGRGRNALGGARCYYGTYECSDGRHIAVGAIEDTFWNALADALGLDHEERVRTPERNEWLVRRLTDIFRTASSEEWQARLSGKNLCVTPVVELRDAPDQPHLRERGTYVRISGLDHPAPAPRFSRTPGAIQETSPPGANGAERLRAWGVEL